MIEPEHQLPGAPAIAERPGTPVELRRIGLALLDSQVWIAIATVLGGGLSFFGSKYLLSVQYRADCVVEWKPIGGNVEETGGRTLVESVKLPTNLAAVRTRLDLPVTLTALGAAVEVSSAKKSRLISISAVQPDAESSQSLANAVAGQFVTSRDMLRRVVLERHVSIVQDDARRAGEVVGLARAELDRFRRVHHLLDFRLEREKTMNRSVRASNEAEMAMAVASGETARQRALAKVAKGLTQRVVQNEIETDLLGRKLDEARANLLEARASHTDAHPVVEGLSAKVQKLEVGSLGASPTTMQRTWGINTQWTHVQSEITGSEASRDAANARRNVLDASAGSAAERLRWLKEIEPEYEALSLRLKSLEAHHEVLIRDLAQAVDAAAHANSGLSVVSPAERPTNPSHSSKRLAFTASVVGSFVLGILIVLARCLRRGACYVAAEFAYWSNMPVLGATGWPALALPLKTVVEPLLSQAAGIHRLLLVPGSAVDVGATQRLARGLRSHLARRTVVGKPEIRVGAIADVVHTLPKLRNQVREANIIVVVATSGAHNAFSLLGLRDRLGAQQAVAVLVVGVGVELAMCVDRVGEVDEFWSGVSGTVPVKGAATSEG